MYPYMDLLEVFKIKILPIPKWKKQSSFYILKNRNKGLTLK